MEDIFDFPSVLNEARDLFAARTRVFVEPKELKNHRVDRSGGIYMLAIKNNEIACVWVGNVRKDRIGNPKKDGTCTVFSTADITGSARYDALRIKEGFTAKEWDRIGVELIHLHEQLK